MKLKRNLTDSGRPVALFLGTPVCVLNGAVSSEPPAPGPADEHWGPQTTRALDVIRFFTHGTAD